MKFFNPLSAPRRHLAAALLRAGTRFSLWPALLQAAMVALSCLGLYLGLAWIIQSGFKDFEAAASVQDQATGSLRRYLALVTGFGGLLTVGLMAAALVAWLASQRRVRRAGMLLQHLQSFTELSSEAVYGIDREGRCIFCNRACLRLLGYEQADQLLGRDMHAQLGMAAAALRCPVAKAMEEGQAFHSQEEEISRADGSKILVERHSSLLMENGRVGSAAVTLRDISGLKAQRETALNDREALEKQVKDLSKHSDEMEVFSKFTEMLQACIHEGDLGRVVAAFAQDFFPQSCGALYLLAQGQLLLEVRSSWGQGAPASLQAVHPRDCWAVRRGKPHYQESPPGDIFCAHVGLQNPAFTFCLPLTGEEGILGLFYLRAGKDDEYLSEAGRLLAIALAYQVALALTNIRLKQILREDAVRDPVTGLYNRRYMKESLGHEILRSRRNSTRVGVLALDLDHFKNVNDSLGHASGDAMLKGIAQAILSSVRAEDIVCRLGGDEFLVILPEISGDGAWNVAEAARKAVSTFTREHFASLEKPVTLSLGIALFPEDGPDIEALLLCADQALYRAKEQGRDRIVGSGLSSMKGAA